MGVWVCLGTVPGHPVRRVVHAGDSAAGQGVRAETARGVRRVPLGVGQLLVVGLHGRRHHVEHDDRRAHGLTEHVLSSGMEKRGRERFERRMRGRERDFSPKYFSQQLLTQSCLHKLAQ